MEHSLINQRQQLLFLVWQRAVEESLRDMEREERTRRRQRREEKERQGPVVEGMHESTRKIEEVLSAVAAAEVMSEAPLATNEVL